MIIKCTKEDCKHEWNYKGKSKFYATCPNCYRKVKISKGEKDGEQKRNMPRM